jgi:hypothetical protein
LLPLLYHYSISPLYNSCTSGTENNKKNACHHITSDSHSICSYSFFLSVFLFQQILHGIRAWYITLSQFRKQELESASQESTFPSVRRPAIETISSTHEAREETKSKIDHIQTKIHKSIQTTKRLYHIEKYNRLESTVHW